MDNILKYPTAINKNLYKSLESLRFNIFLLIPSNSTLKNFVKLKLCLSKEKNAYTELPMQTRW